MSKLSPRVTYPQVHRQSWDSILGLLIPQYTFFCLSFALSNHSFLPSLTPLLTPCVVPSNQVQSSLMAEVFPHTPRPGLIPLSRPSGRSMSLEEERFLNQHPELLTAKDGQ